MCVSVSVKILKVMKHAFFIISYNYVVLVYKICEVYETLFEQLLNYTC